MKKQTQSKPIRPGRGGPGKSEARNPKQARKANDQDAQETENKANWDRRARQTKPISGFSGQKRGASEETNPIEANSPGSWRAREIRSSKLEIRNKSEMQMLETNHSAPNKPNWAGDPPLGIGDSRQRRRGMTNKANLPARPGEAKRQEMSNEANLRGKTENAKCFYKGDLWHKGEYIGARKRSQSWRWRLLRCARNDSEANKAKLGEDGMFGVQMACRARWRVGVSFEPEGAPPGGWG